MFSTNGLREAFSLISMEALSLGIHACRNSGLDMDVFAQSSFDAWVREAQTEINERLSDFYGV